MRDSVVVSKIVIIVSLNRCLDNKHRWLLAPPIRRLIYVQVRPFHCVMVVIVQMIFL